MRAALARAGAVAPLPGGEPLALVPGPKTSDVVVGGSAVQPMAQRSLLREGEREQEKEDNGGEAALERSSEAPCRNVVSLGISRVL